MSGEKAKSSGKSVLQIILIVLGGIAGMALGGTLIAVTLIASPIITVLILVFLIAYGITAAVSSRST